MAALDYDARYAVDGYPGVAFWIKGHPTVAVMDDWEELYETDLDRVVVVMVGDDREFNVGVDELTPIDDDAYCAGCGQIGCSHGL